MNIVNLKNYIDIILGYVICLVSHNLLKLILHHLEKMEKINTPHNKKIMIFQFIYLIIILYKLNQINTNKRLLMYNKI